MLNKPAGKSLQGPSPTGCRGSPLRNARHCRTRAVWPTRHISHCFSSNARSPTMENKLPFTSYDFWAYLSAVFLLLFVVDHVAGTNLLMRETWTVVQSVVAFSCAYAVGHVVASMSSF